MPNPNANTGNADRRSVRERYDKAVRLAARATNDGERRAALEGIGRILQTHPWLADAAQSDETAKGEPQPIEWSTVVAGLAQAGIDWLSAPSGRKATRRAQSRITDQIVEVLVGKKPDEQQKQKRNGRKTSAEKQIDRMVVFDADEGDIEGDGSDAEINIVASIRAEDLINIQDEEDADLYTEIGKRIVACGIEVAIEAGIIDDGDDTTEESVDDDE